MKLRDYLRLGMYEYLDLGPKWKKSLRRVQMLGDVPVLVTDPPESPKFAVGEVWRFGNGIMLDSRSSYRLLCRQ